MTVTITWQTFITAAALIAAVIAIYKYIKAGIVRAEQPVQNAEAIDELKIRHDEDIKAIKTEQTVVVYGVLACLKGLAEQGCDGPVHDAIDKLEKHLNVKAHE